MLHPHLDDLTELWGDAVPILLLASSSTWEHIVGDLSKGGLKMVEISELDVVLKFSFLQHMEGKTKRMVWGPPNTASERESEGMGPFKYHPSGKAIMGQKKSHLLLSFIFKLQGFKIGAW